MSPGPASPAADLGSTAPHPGYRPCVGLMLIRRPWRIFIGERLGPPRDLWQMPQGGIDPGEAPSAAARRELREEVGTDKAELLAESRRWYAYDLPADLARRSWHGRFRGQTQRWFAFGFLGEDADIEIGGDEAEFARWRWAAPEEVLRLVWAPKRPIYEAVLAEFAHLLT